MGTVREKSTNQYRLPYSKTDILLFVLPLTLTFIDLKYSGAAVCAAATFAAIQEGHLIRTGSVKK